jgi:hypothetical protein
LFFLTTMGIIKAQTIITGFSEDFEDPWTTEDSVFWAPNGGFVDNQAPDDTLIFTVMRMDDGTGNMALHIDLIQKNFFDGQMYLLKDAKDQVLDATLNPVASFRLRLDSATWLIPDWNQGGKLVPAPNVPFQISFFVGENRLSSYSYRVPIDGDWHEYVFNLNADADLTAIEKILIESVDWPNANKAYYWFDDFRVGDSVMAFVPLTSVDITGAAPITVNNQKLQLGIDYSPAEASFKEVSWSVINGTGKATISDAGLLTPVADGDVQVVAVATDVSGSSDTVTITMINQYDTISTYSQTFNDANAVDMDLWAPNKGYRDVTEPFDSLIFTVTTEESALHVLLQQQNFFDGQMYDFKNQAGKILDINDHPLASILIKIDSAEWLVQDWNLGGILVPSSTVPFQLSPFVGDTRLAMYNNDIAIDGESHTVYYTFFNPSVDMGGVEKLLLESVSWPKANKAYFWIDNFKVGAAVSIPNPVTSITVTGKDGANTISVKGKTLQMNAAVEPDSATFSGVYWSVNDTLVATINTNGLLKPVTDGVVSVIAEAVDASGVTGILDITITNQSAGIPDAEYLSYRVFPNPAADVLIISGMQDVRKVQVMNLAGQPVLVSDGNYNEINVSKLDAGLYILKITNANNQVFHISFIKE